MHTPALPEPLAVGTLRLALAVKPQPLTEAVVAAPAAREAAGAEVGAALAPAPVPVHLGKSTSFHLQAVLHIVHKISY